MTEPLFSAVPDEEFARRTSEKPPEDTERRDARAERPDSEIANRLLRRS